MNDSKKILIITGEASGDLHASNLIREVQQLLPGVSFTGMGSQSMKAAGAHIIIDSASQAVMGIFEVIRYIPRIYKNYQQLKTLIKSQSFDLIIFVDYPGINLKLAKIAKKAGKPFLYYIGPQVWAWRQWRVKYIKKYIENLAVILPFEENFYQKHGMKVNFVGHPLLNYVKADVSPNDLKKIRNINPHTKIIGLLPGSRTNEIKYILPTLIQAAQKLKQHFQDIEFILPLAHTLNAEEIKKSLPSDLNIKIETQKHYNLINMCDAVIAVSGTVTLEISLLETPMVIVYKLNSLSLAIAKPLIKIPYVGLCNIIAEKKIVPEFIQENATPQNIADEIIRLIEDENHRNVQITHLREVNNKLNAAKNGSIGQLVCQMLN